MGQLYRSIVSKFQSTIKQFGAKRIAIIGIAVVLLLGGTFFLGHQHARTGSSHDGAANESTLYQCPMHPTYVSDQPGECPICGMTLVEVEQSGGSGEHAGYESDVEGYASIKLAPQRQQLIGVKTDTVKIRKLIREIHTVGWIAYDPDLYHAQEEYLSSLEGMRKMSESTIPEIRERSKKLVESARLRLRILGINNEQIDKLTTEVGPDTRLLLGDVLDSVWLYGTVYEYELQLVQRGDPVDVEIRAFPGETFSGTVQSIDTVLDPITRSARVRVIIPNPEGKLKPQMFANAVIGVSLGESLAVPESAVIDTGTRKVVFVDHGNGNLVPHDVKLGHKAEGYYAVVDGLEEGNIVVTSGNFLIDSESKLRSATNSAAAGAHHNH